MLRACYRVLKPGGTTAFAVIAVADGLREDDLASAIAAGPPYVAAEPGYPGLIAMTGFAEIRVTDVTADYLATSEAWIRSWNDEAAELSAILGEAAFTENQEERRQSADAIERGLLKRYLISARRK